MEIGSGGVTLPLSGVAVKHPCDYDQVMREQDALALHDLVERRGRFGHREHLELAWTYLRSYPPA